MEKAAQVEEAKALFTTARDWSIVRWLAEKRHVRAIADRATATLDEMERSVKSTWSEQLKNAYSECAGSADGDDPFAAAERQFAGAQAQSIPEEVRTAARRVREADEAATEARLAAERTFEQAEWRLSSSTAKRGADEAIRAYDLRYKAIAEAEAARTI